MKPTSSDFLKYQLFVASTKVNPPSLNPSAYPLFWLTGLSEELGEVAGKIKRAYRDNGDEIVFDKEAIIKEMGDMLWYFTCLAMELDIDLNTISQENIKKLKARFAKGNFHGEGDDR